MKLISRILRFGFGGKHILNYFKKLDNTTTVHFENPNYARNGAKLNYINYFIK